MSIRRRMGKTKKKPPLGRREWIDAAFRALEQGGLAAVRVESLARVLGVTKGSFYWHFEDRRALLDAMLERWRRIATDAVIDAVERAERSPAERLRVLMSITASGRGDRTEAAVRAWAMTDPDARETVAAMDARRERFVTGLLTDHGVPPRQAAHRARALYLALIGEFTWVAQGGRSSSRSMWEHLVELMLG